MALMSMTGFARVQGQNGPWTWVWEARSVNARGLDVRVRLAPGCEAVEPEVRALAAKTFRRGTINLSLNLTREQAGGDLRINEAALAAVLGAIKRLKNLGFDDPDPAAILALRGVLEQGSAADDPEVIEARDAALVRTAAEAITALARARADEGRGLTEVLRAQVERIATLSAAAGSLAFAQPEKVRERMKNQIAELLGAGAPLPEDRLAQELAAMAVKADVREELDRLGVHVVSARELLGSSDAVGRKLDFLTQEFNREANTICSKAGDIALTQIGLDLKTVIDQVREQVQNVE